jgi:Tir chaperone protein (CesT) family
MAALDHHMLLAELGRKVAIPDLAFDEDGYCCLSFDDSIVNLEFRSDRRDFLIYAAIGRVEGHPPADYLGRLMQAGYAASLANGGGIGLDHVAGAIMFVQTIPLRGLTADDFTEEIRRIVERIETWQRVVEELRHSRGSGNGQVAPDYANGAAMIRG